MTGTRRDPLGTAVAILAGVLGGLLLVRPMLPARSTLPELDATVGPVGGYLLLGVSALAAVPMGIALLYLFFVQVDT
ncbi:hypothetical protein BRC75_02140 [Halobacteriales archaeon QH_7_69_31]|nr:MAG: hypothetical protein BRC75_02140 [Halobacteriales archaeon QH_7_69_31]